MRHSSEKHNVARLRVVLGEKQDAFAKLIGCSVQAVQSIETGRLKLSEEMARRISDATGVHLRWLLDNDLDAEIVGSPDGRPFTKSDFEHRQALKKIGSNEFMQFMIGDYAAAFYGQIRAMLSSAVKRDSAEIATWKVAKFLDDCRNEFGHDEKLVPEEKFGLRDDGSPSLKHQQVEAGIALFNKDDKERVKRGIALFQNYNREREKIIREGLSAPKK